MGIWRTACVLVLLALAGCRARAGPDAPVVAPDAAVVRCVNPANGFAWTLRLDADRGVVDGWPARFGAQRIAWRDGADGGAYELDRASGALTIVRASSTGGYTSFDRCVAAGRAQAVRMGDRRP